MEKPNDKNTGCMELLLVASEGRSLANLRDLLAQYGRGQLHLDCISSCGEARKRNPDGHYDLVLCDFAAGEEECGALEKDKLPVIFLGDNADEPKMRRTLQSVLCNFERGVNPAEPCTALAILAAVARNSRERQRQSTEEMLRKLRHTVEQSPDLVMITDRSGVLEYVNPAFETVTG